MKTGIVILAALLAGCGLGGSYVQRTRVTASGGEYTLYISLPSGVSAAVAQALGAMSADCSGAYEVVGLELLPSGDGLDHSYLDTSFLIMFGQFRTGIAYECRPPQSTMLNERLQSIAATAPPPEPPGPPRQACLVTNDCPPGRICGLTQAECDSY